MFRQTEFDDSGNLAPQAEVMRSVTNRQLTSRALRMSDILLQKSAGTPTLPGRVVRVRNELAPNSTFSNFLQLIRADKSKIDSGYLFWVLFDLHASGKALEYQRGTNIKNLDLKEYLKTKIHLPPLDVQRRIVDVIEHIDSVIHAAADATEKTRTARAALLANLLNPETCTFVDSQQKAVKSDWTESTLEDIADFINGYPFKPDELGSHGKPVIRIRQLLDPQLQPDRTQIEVPERYLLKNGDLIFSWSGTLAVRIWNRGDAILNQHLFRVVEKQGHLREWVALALDHAIGDLVTKSHGSTMKHITKATLLPHEVSTPPLEVQRQIVDVISAVDAVIVEQSAVEQKARATRAAILADLLSGNHEILESYDEFLEAI